MKCCAWVCGEVRDLKSPQQLGAGGKRQNLHQWKPASNSWSEFILYMPAVQEPWHLSCQSSFTFTHSSSFQSQCDNCSMLPPSPPLCCVFKQGWRLRELGCNEPMTDGASLRRRQEDLWQGLDADIKSQEMHCASSLCHISFLSLLVSSPLSLSCFVSSLVFVSPLCPITSLCPSSYSLPVSLSLLHCLFSFSTASVLLSHSAVVWLHSTIVSQCISSMDKMTATQKQNASVPLWSL